MAATIHVHYPGLVRANWSLELSLCFHSPRTKLQQPGSNMCNNNELKAQQDVVPPPPRPPSKGRGFDSHRDHPGGGGEDSILQQEFKLTFLSVSERILARYQFPSPSHLAQQTFPAVGFEINSLAFDR